MAAKFVAYADSGGTYRWKLVASNGQTTASSGESFDSKANAQGAVEAVRKAAATAEVVEEWRRGAGRARRPATRPALQGL